MAQRAGENIGSGMGAEFHTGHGVPRKDSTMRRTMTVAIMALICAAGSAWAGPGKIAKDGVNKAFKVAGLPSPFGRHEAVEPIQINGKYVYILDLVDHDGSRCTASFHAKWEGERKFKVLSEGLPMAFKMKAAWQRKGDKQRKPDTDRGDSFKLGDTIVIDGTYNYLAQRGEGWTSERESENPDAMLILAEEGVTLEQIHEYFAN